MRGKPWVSAVAFLPDGRRAVTGDLDGRVSLWDLWDLGSGDEQRRLPGLGTMVRAVGGDARGRLVLAAGTGSLRLFDAGDGRSVYALRGVGGGIISAALLPDARHVLLSRYNGTLQLWRLPAGVADDGPSGPM